MEMKAMKCLQGLQIHHDASSKVCCDIYAKLLSQTKLKLHTIIIPKPIII